MRHIYQLIKSISTLICIILIVGCVETNDSIESPVFHLSGVFYDVEGELILQVNGDEQISLTTKEFGEFEFSSNFENNESYSVSILRQPENQICRLRNETGTIQESDFEDVLVTCQSYYRGLVGATEVSTGDAHTCALINGLVECWGANFGGQLNVPAGLINPRTIAAGFSHTCVIDDTGVVCWGEGPSDLPFADAPRTFVNPSELSSGAFASCVIDDKGLLCWGNEDASSNITDYPKNLADPHGLVVKGSNVCVIDGKRPVCWGYNKRAVTLPDTLVEVDAIDIGRIHGCAINSDEITCWGDNGTSINNVPESIANINSLALGFDTSCALDTGGRLKCWGRGAFGISDLEVISQSITKISMNVQHGCAIDDEGIVCVGTNRDHELEVPSY